MRSSARWNGRTIATSRAQLRVSGSGYLTSTLSEGYVNNWVGGLLGSNPDTALALFKYNARHWPQSSDAFDSLGETGTLRLRTKRVLLEPTKRPWS
jgi:hypothetical protein